MDRGQSLHGFELHDDSVINQEIGAESFLEYHLFVFEADGSLSLDLKPTFVSARASTASYTDSSSPGPKSRWMRSEASTICPVMSSSSRIPFSSVHSAAPRDLVGVHTVSSVPGEHNQGAAGGILLCRYGTSIRRSRRIESSRNPPNTTTATTMARTRLMCEPAANRRPSIPCISAMA